MGYDRIKVPFVILRGFVIGIFQAVLSVNEKEILNWFTSLYKKNLNIFQPLVIDLMLGFFIEIITVLHLEF